MKNTGISFKYTRPTEYKYGHTKIFENENEIGFFMPLNDTPKIREIGKKPTIPWIIQFWWNEMYLTKKVRSRKKAIEYLEKVVSGGVP